MQITVAESIGIEDRGPYYERAGALRDMVQNHILQLLCLIAMEPPTRFEADSVRDEKLKVLRALRPIAGDEVASKTVRGQYRAGAIDGDLAPGYLEEIDALSSLTETFVVVKAEIELALGGGAVLSAHRQAHAGAGVRDRRPVSRHTAFDLPARRRADRGQSPGGAPATGRGHEALPDGQGSRPGRDASARVPLNLSFAETFKVRYPDAYERLLMDVVRGNPTLFMRRDEIEAAWAWVEPILAAWRERGDPPKSYAAGTWGPSAAVALIERDGSTFWQEDAA